MREIGAARQDNGHLCAKHNARRIRAGEKVQAFRENVAGAAITVDGTLAFTVSIAERMGTFTSAPDKAWARSMAF